MPSSLLRALTNRSTPTLPSERAERQKNVRMVLTPSIFITLPLEEGGHFWCVYPGSACPLPLPVPSTPTATTSNSSFDVPIPDIAAIEETVDRLRRAGETPTFRRPSRANEVVLPKKKFAHAHGHDHHRHGLEDVSTMGRSTPEDGKKKRKSRPPPLTSISYESIVSQSFSPTSPEAFHVSMPSRDTESKPKEKKRNSLGWIFSSNKRSTIRKDNNMGSILESEQFEAQFAITREYDDGEVTLDQVMESTLPNSPGAESTHTTATYESDLDKPLPPLPPSKSFQQDLSLTRYQSRGLPSEPVEEQQQQQKDSNNESSARPSTPSKIKRKFSLKKLRERFISSPSPAPPVPELPNAAFTQAGNVKPTSSNAIVLGVAGVSSHSGEQPIDPPFTPPPIPSLDSVPREFPVIDSIEVVEAIESSSSGPIDLPFTPPLSVPESSSSESHALETEPVIAVPLLLKDEETEPDLSTASEDSTNTAGSSRGSSSTTSTPESSPPDTPANVDFGAIFGEMDQVAAKLPLAVVEMEKKMAVVVLNNNNNEGAMTRSNGYRTKLASLHFDQIEFDTTAF